MQSTIDSYEKISKIEEEKSIEKIGWIILSIADHLSEKHNGRIIPHSELVDEARKNCKLETIQIHEALRHLIEKPVELLYEVENAPVVCYTRQEPKRAVVYETNN